MLKIFCDLCKKEVNTNVPPIVDLSINNGNEFNRIDLCQKCQKKIHDFIAMEMTKE